MSDESPREIYTHGHPAPVLQSHRWRTAENSAGYLLSLLSPGTTVLDIGCGPGTITADVGRRLVAWFHAAGYANVTASASTWCFATAEDRAWWAHTWAQRITDSPLADRAVQIGVATRDDLAGCAAAWHRWAAARDGYFVTVHGEVLATA
jgi:hypothetical protein